MQLNLSTFTAGANEEVAAIVAEADKQDLPTAELSHPVVARSLPVPERTVQTHISIVSETIAENHRRPIILETPEPKNPNDETSSLAAGESLMVAETAVELQSSAEESIQLPPVAIEYASGSKQQVAAELPKVHPEAVESSNNPGLPGPNEALFSESYRTMLLLLRPYGGEGHVMLEAEPQATYDVDNQNINIERPAVVETVAHSLELALPEQQEVIKHALAEVLAILQIMSNPDEISLVTPRQQAAYTERLRTVLRQITDELDIVLNEVESEQLLTYLVSQSSDMLNYTKSANRLWDWDLGTHEHKQQGAIASSAIFIEEHLHRLLGMLAIASPRAAYIT